MDKFKILQGDALEQLRLLPADHVQCVVTSPPYWGLRKYGDDAREMGSEKTFEQYLANMTAVFEEVRRTLRPDGTLWLNMGDSYANNLSNGRVKAREVGGNKPHHSGMDTTKKGFKTKDLIGQPWAMAFALRVAGWYLRQEIIWAKPNPMPESCQDRPTQAHEQIFLMSKSPRYFYDIEAIKEEAKDPADDLRRMGQQKRGNKSMPTDLVNGLRPRNPPVGGWNRGAGSHSGKDFNQGERKRSNRDNFKRVGSKRNIAIPNQTVGTHRENRKDSNYQLGWRNKRSVWTIATSPFAEAHYATFPAKLVEPCILAGSRPGDLVMDPFSGAGTVGKVASERGRRYLGIELYQKNIEITDRRMMKVQAGLEL